MPFTLWEAVSISQYLDISIDKLSKLSLKGNAVFSFNLMNCTNPIETYYHTAHYYNEVIEKIEMGVYSELYTSSNIIPQTICLAYKNIAKFLLFKWIYQQETFTFNKTYDELILPDKIYTVQKEFANKNLHYKYTCFIWDVLIFSFIVNDIKYYSDLGIISPQNMKEIQFDLQKILDEIELIASKGTNKLENQLLQKI